MIGTRLGKDESDDVISMSFVDVLANGLGAAILLFLILATMPRLGLTATSTGHQGPITKQMAASSPVGDEARERRTAPVHLDVRFDGPRAGAIDGRWLFAPEGARTIHTVHARSRAFELTLLDARDAAQPIAFEVDGSALSARSGIVVRAFVGGKMTMVCVRPRMTSRDRVILFDFSTRRRGCLIEVKLPDNHGCGCAEA